MQCQSPGVAGCSKHHCLRSTGLLLCWTCLWMSTRGGLDEGLSHFVGCRRSWGEQAPS